MRVPGATVTRPRPGSGGRTSRWGRSRGSGCHRERPSPLPAWELQVSLACGLVPRLRLRRHWALPPCLRLHGASSSDRSPVRWEQDPPWWPRLTRLHLRRPRPRVTPQPRCGFCRGSPPPEQYPTRWLFTICSRFCSRGSWARRPLSPCPLGGLRSHSSTWLDVEEPGSPPRSHRQGCGRVFGGRRRVSLTPGVGVGCPSGGRSWPGLSSLSTAIQMSQLRVPRP